MRRADAQMETLYAAEDEFHPTLPGSCHGYNIARAIKKSAVLPQVRSFLSRKIVDCYIATYLGCQVGQWIGAPMASAVGPDTQPFTLSKVTIVEQTPDRVVADVTEAPSEVVNSDGILFEQDSERPVTNTSWVQDWSRYTIEREKDGVWRITDRKPSGDWYCPSPSRTR